MVIKSVTTVYFSPTGTTKKIIKAVVKGLGVSDNTIDLTSPQVRESGPQVIAGDMAVIGVPVYSMGVPEILGASLKSLKGQGKPVLLIAVYGNVTEGATISELYDIAVKAGFHVVGAASFIGEHSFAAESAPLAKDRPNAKDLEVAEAFGKEIFVKLREARELSRISWAGFQGEIRMFFKIARYVRKIYPINSGKVFTKTPLAVAERCNQCGRCARLCPTGAIDGDTLAIRNKQCIRCFSCVKHCPQKARAIVYRPKILVEKYLNRKCGIYKEAQIY
ncbi:MAG TPA: EFR1 family ferrodoxin [Bacillota bacterium]|nr:EFR1 family ferrodoxin [Bacillota bacterium]